MKRQARHDYKTEVELGRTVVANLTRRGFEVKPEVQPVGHDTTADVVAVGFGELWVIELKLHLGLDVIAQAAHWVSYCHRSWVAVPLPDGSRQHSPAWILAQDVLRSRQIGLLGAFERRGGGEGRAGLVELVEGRLCALPRDLGLLAAFQAQPAYYTEAGNPRSERWTPFRATCERLRVLVRTEPGLTVREAVGRIEHHYASEASAVQSVKECAKAGQVPGVRGRYDGRRYRLEPTED